MGRSKGTRAEAVGVLAVAASPSPRKRYARKKGIVKAIGGAMRVARIHSAMRREERKPPRERA